MLVICCEDESMGFDTSRSRSRDTVHDERRSIATLLNRFNAVNDDNALDPNHADHLHDYFGTDLSTSDSGFDDIDDTDTSDLESKSYCTEKQTPRQCSLCPSVIEGPEEEVKI